MNPPTIAEERDLLSVALDNLGVPDDTYPAPVAYAVGLLTGMRARLDPDTQVIVTRDSLAAAIALRRFSMVVPNPPQDIVDFSDAIFAALREAER